ncbi:MAG TPA: hypothetical protein VFZ65_14160 [Planctomycetota bacterium]|nr:hypothetical protein [Planctomycetota bacterium]
MRLLPSLLVVPLATLALPTHLAAQVAHQGNGIGAAYVRTSTATIGGTLELEWGSPNIPNGLTALCSSDGYGPVMFPGVGSVWMDYLSPQFYYGFFFLDAQGEQSGSLPVPSGAALVGNPPLFVVCVACEPSGWSISKTARIDFENANAYRAVGAMGSGRALHTATALGASGRDNETRVLITGGGGGTVLQPLASATTEFYVPLTRSFSPGPTMAVERTLHRAVRLDDGRVLLIGGVDSLGVVTRGCEIFDPANDTLSPTGDLTVPRAGHDATLLANGKVLVTGGLADYVNPLTNLLVVLNTAQDTAELYDPASGTWTAVPGTMASRHSGHTQTLLPSGMVLIAGGIQGATLSTLFMQPVPVYTGSCSIYDPATNSLSTTGSLLFPRGFHAASVLANGNVLVTGGSVSNILFGSVTASPVCEVWNGSTWSQTGPLPQALTNHMQIADANGNAVIFGGLTGAFPTLTAVDISGRHDGTTYTPGPLLGENPGLPAAPITPRAAGALTVLGDGTWLLSGGTDGTAPLTSTLIFHP